MEFNNVLLYATLLTSVSSCVVAILAHIRHSRCWILEFETNHNEYSPV